MIKLCQDAGLRVFRDPTRQVFVSFPHSGHREIWHLDSYEVEAFMAHLYFEKRRRSIPQVALGEAKRELRHIGLFLSTEEPVFLRVASTAKALYVDLCDPYWRCVQLIPGSWKVLDKSPVNFRRAAGMLALPQPDREGHHGLLRNYIHFQTDKDYYLTLAWLTFCYCERGAYPLALIVGEQGTGKSEAAKMLKALVDPSAAPTCTEPDSLRNLAISAENCWVIFWDNLSFLHGWQQDALARVATGGSFRIRKLHTGREEELFHTRRPVIVTSILDVVTQPDLMQRTLHVQLKTLEQTERQALSDLWRAFCQDYALLFGGLLNLTCRILAEMERLPNVPLERMGDYHRWLMGMEMAIGLPCGSLTDAYRENLRHGQGIALEQNGLLPALVKFLENKIEWVGSAAELLVALHETYSERERGSDFPRSAKSLGRALTRLAPALRDAGYVAERSREEHSRRWTIRRAEAKETSGTSGTSGTQKFIEIPPDFLDSMV